MKIKEKVIFFFELSSFADLDFENLYFMLSQKLKQLGASNLVS